MTAPRRWQFWIDRGGTFTDCLGVDPATGEVTAVKVLSDDLSLPPPGQAKVRIVNASLNAPLVDVSVQNGPTVATGVAFANSSQYGSVPAGSWTLSVTPKEGATTPSTGNVDLAAGSVYSVLLLDEAGGTVEIRELPKT